MRIAIIGSGNVGQALAKNWLGLGHTVTFGLRNPDSPKAQAARAEVSGAEYRDMGEAAKDSELILVAARPDAVQDIAGAVGPLQGRILVDAMNSMGPKGEWPTTTHGFVALLGSVGVVKAFNTLGAEVLGQPQLAQGSADLVISGEDAEAKQKVSGLAIAMGFGAVHDLGGADFFSLQESLAQFWIHLAMRRGYGRNFGWKLLSLSVSLNQKYPG